MIFKKMLMFITLGLAILATEKAFAAKEYIFSLDFMKSLATSLKGMEGSDGRELDKLLAEVHNSLYRAYPELVVPPEQDRWIFNSVGGSLAQIKILYCSPTEYLALWGSPLETDGHSGRYSTLDVWDIMLTGLMKSYAPGGNHQYDIYENEGRQGSHNVSFLKKGVAKHFWLGEGTYMIDYGRGNLLKALNAGGVNGHKYVTADKVSRKALMGECARQSIANLTQSKRKKAIKRYKQSNPDNQ